MNPLMPIEDPKDLAEDLAKTLPKWVSWIPVVGKASYRWWDRRKVQRRIENQVLVEFMSARLYVHARDEASVELLFHITNLSSVSVEIDRLELHSLQIGTRSLQRRGDMLKMSGTVLGRSTNRISAHIDLHGSDLRHVIQGVGKSVNLWSSPQASVSVYAQILFLTAKARFHTTLQHSTDLVECRIGTAVAEALLLADGVTSI